MNKFLTIITLLFTYGFQAQQTEYVDFKTANIDVNFKADATKVFGVVRYEVKILKPVDSIFMDAINMKFNHVTLNNKRANYRNDTKKIWIKHAFKANKSYEISFNYEASPKKAIYFIDWDFDAENKQIWTQGQGKYTSNWLPSIDDMNDKITFNLTIEFDKNYDVIANGTLKNKQINHSTITWQYNMQQPMSSYLVALVIGKYDKKVAFSKSGIPLEMYYYPKDSIKVEPTYRYTKQMFDVLEDEIGVPYPWQNYKQVPVKDFLYAGMENTSITIFSDSFVTDSIAFVDKNYVNVNAHELAHQWFGNLVTATSSTHHWLQEGFATYYALLAEKDIFGADYYYWQLYQYCQELIEQDKAGAGTALLNPASSSITFYKKGAWVLHILRETVGDKAFKTAVKNYLKKHQFKNVETSDFIIEVEKASGQNLNKFVEEWLKTEVFQKEKAFESLRKSAFMDDYLLVSCEANNNDYGSYLTSNISDEAKIKIIAQNPQLIKKETFKSSLKVRQAIAENLLEIPSELKEIYETLLHDTSYITIEKALFNLWMNFPQQRNKYLEQTKDIQGFSDKNIRTLWLTLALLTDGFLPENKQHYYQELVNYTNPVYSFEIRQQAFSYLQEIKGCNNHCLENLKQAATHNNWRFSKFAKTILQQND